MKVRACLLVAILTLYAMSLGFCPAQAWVAEEWYESPTDLPVSIQAVLPADTIYVDGIRGVHTIYVLLAEGDGSRRVYIFRKEGDVYQLECTSAPLADRDGSKACIGCSGGDMLHLIYGGGDALFTFCRTYRNTWTLRCVQAGETFNFDSIGLHGWWPEQHLCGTVGNTDLSTLDATRLPATTAEALSLIDTDGWAFVKSDKPTDRLHLRAAPSTDAASIGRYYSGTPVQILEDQGEWVKVSVVGIQGFMMKKFLAFGQDMLNVERWFLPKQFIEEDVINGVNVYSNPDTNAGVVGVLREGEYGTVHIIATVGDNWYHVLCDDGLSGYVEARHFWDGNG